MERKNIYYSICTNTEPRPWPNPNTGKAITQYAFSIKSLPSLTLLHSISSPMEVKRQWYEWSESKKKDLLK